jgi:hypothetical protein
MDRVKCATCGAEHDLSVMEPSFDRPDAYLEVPEGERAERTYAADDYCVVWDADGTPRRHFLRVLVPVPVRGESEGFCWGAWAEVAEPDFARAFDNATHPDQASWPPFAGALANRIPLLPADAASTLGLPGSVRLTGPTTLPEFWLDANLAHPFAREQREGVYPERLLEYLSPGLHS